MSEGFFATLSTLGEGHFPEYIWILVIGFIIAFFLAFSVGANDVANPFGTSVGSGALTLLQVCIAATFMESLGALTLGGAVSDTIRKKIVDPDLFNNMIPQFMIGQACAMLGAASWQILASVLKMPVSGTHSIVGAVLGFALVSQRGKGIFWWTIFKIVLSWFISPVLSGFAAVILYTILKYVILSRGKDKTKRALIVLPFFYAIVILLNVFSILYTGSHVYQIEILEVWHMILIAFGAAVVVWLVFFFVIVPKQKKQIEKINSGTVVKTDGCLEKVEKKLGWDADTRRKAREAKEAKKDSEALVDNNAIVQGGYGKGMKRNASSESMGSLASIASKISNISNSSRTSIFGVVKGGAEGGDGEPDESLFDGSEDDVMRYLFSHLQAFSACLDAFAHGGNDVGNSIGPVLALWSAFKAGNLLFEDAVDPWIIGYGCIGIIFGLWILGRRVIETVGEDIAEITPARGFSIDIMAGLTVLLGSNFGIPLSTTHCKVGAVVAVSLMHNRKAVSWRTFGNIAWAWIVTLPVSGAISALCYWLITYFMGFDNVSTVSTTVGPMNATTLFA